MASSQKGIGIVAGLVVGATAGWVLARMTDETRPLDVAAGSKAATELSPETEQGSELAEPERLPGVAEPPASDRTITAGDVPVFHLGLQQHGRVGIRAGWNSVRGNTIPEAILEEGMSNYEQVVLESPESIGRSLGQREDERDAAREDAATGGVFAVLESLGQGKAGPMTEFTTDPEVFGRFFVRTSQDKIKNGVDHLERLYEALEDGAVVQFPAGVFRTQHPFSHENVPRDVILTGAGMDATLLLIEELDPNERLRNLTLRDCTILTRQYLFDIRGELSSIQLDRVRIIGFDKGSGSSCVFGTSGAAIYARNSRFEGGYGRWPRSGQLFDARSSALLARFEGCTFDLINLETRRIQPGASVVYSNCRMANILDRDAQDQVRRKGVLFPGTVIDYYDWEQGNPAQKDLNDLFPNWEERVNQ